MENIQVKSIQESRRRLCEKLNRDLGEIINSNLENSDVNEIMLNPDSTLWVDSSRQGLECIGNMSKTAAFAIINTVAGIHNRVISDSNPHLEAEFPIYANMRSERFTAQIPPIVSSPAFSIRKRSQYVFSLQDYVDTGRLTVEQAKILRELVKNRKNILICGGPGSGKTTVTNALIIEAIKTDSQQRFLILEDVPELQCQAANKVNMLTTATVNMTALLRDAMRMRPDRILIGEVRGGEALDMLKAWNTGCPGGICTVHANGAEEALQRISDLAMEAGLTTPPTNLITHTVDALVFVGRQHVQKGFINEILVPGEYKNGDFKFKKLV